MTDLNTLIPPNSGWILTEARGINDAGQITGTGTINGETHAFLLTPVPSDSTPPVITPTITGALGNNGWYVGPVNISWSVVDNESAISSQSGCSSTTLSDDTSGTTLTCSATSAGGTSTDSVTIKIDQTNPTVVCSASPSVLWPPKHQLVDIITTVSVIDSGSGPGAFSLLSITSNEPDSGLTDVRGWSTGTADTSGQLRAERLGTSTGRIYTLIYQGQDLAGNSGTCTTAVAVPHDQR